MDNRSFNIADEYSRGGSDNFPRGTELALPHGKAEAEAPPDRKLTPKHEDGVPKSEENIERMCGAFNRYPKWLQRFADPRWFLLAYCLQNIIAGAEGSFLIGCTSSIEKHFQFSSGDIGLLILLSELGPIITSVLLSFLGGRGNRPRWLGIGSALGGLGVLVIFITFLIYPAPTLSESGLLDDSKKFCDLQDVINFQFLNSTSTTSPESLAHSLDGGKTCGSSNSSAFFLWLIGFTLKSLSGTIIFTIGAPYMDDSITKNASPIYFAITISIRVLGPTIGFTVSALALNTYVYPGKEFGITAHDPRWIGAWWIGPLVFSILLLSYSFFMSLFPRKLSPRNAKSDAEDATGKDGQGLDKSFSDEDLVKTSVIPRDENPPPYANSNGHVAILNGHPVEDSLSKHDINNWALGRPLSQNSNEVNTNGYDISQRVNGHKFDGHSNGNDNTHLGQESQTTGNGILKSSLGKFLSEEKKNDIKDFIEALKRMMRNKIVTYGALSDFTALVAEAGMFFWLAKYQEHQFRVTKSTAAFFAGISGTTSLLLGVLGGGFWIYKFRPNARIVAYLMTVCSVIYLFTLVGLMFITCDYQNDLPGILSPDGKSVELYRGCSSGCNCDLKEFIPVCVRDGPINLTYFSPCHAGCPDNSGFAKPKQIDSLDADAPAEEVFYNCTCGSSTATITSGYCQETCPGFITYNAVMTIIRSFISVGAIGGTLINMRCVAVEDKAMALGIKTTMLSAALMINPLIYGYLFDSACMLWEETCDGMGSCWLYDTNDLRYKFHGVSAFFFFFCSIFTYIVARSVGDLQLFDEEPPTSTPSPSSPASSFLFSGPGAGRKSSLRRSLKKISRLMGRENGISRSPGRKKEESEQQEPKTTDEVDGKDQDVMGSNHLPEVDNLSESQVPTPDEIDQSLSQSQVPVNARVMLPSRIVKTTGV